MPALDYDARAGLERLQERYGGEVYQDVPDVQGTDEGERLTVTIDAAARVVDLQVLDETRLRLIEDLRGALTDAYREADHERAVASMRASGSFDDFVERAEKRRRNGWKLNVPAPPDVSRDALLGRALRGELRPPSEFALAEPSTGVSANGYLSVQVGASGGARDRRGGRAVAAARGPTRWQPH